jgi:hypothetical protein
VTKDDGPGPSRLPGIARKNDPDSQTLDDDDPPGADGPLM